MFERYFLGVKRIALANGAVVAGYVAGRPVSGRWLARYFLGVGGEVSLPRHLEERVVSLVEMNNVDGQFRAGEWESYSPPSADDLYTCVGSFAARVLRDGTIEYRDIYDWHFDTNWRFRIGPSWLPFSIEVSGSDDMLDDVGKEFLTCGSIPPDVRGNSCRHERAKTLPTWWRLAKMKGRQLWRSLCGEKCYLSKETLAKLAEFGEGGW